MSKDKGHGKRFIGIETDPPFLISPPSQLISPLKEEYPGAEKSVHAVSRLSDSLIDFYVRRNLLNRCNEELTDLSLAYVQLYDDAEELPEGYDSGGIVREPEAKGKLLEAEALVSLYLEGFYIVTDRLCTATIHLNEDSANALWPDIRKPRPHLKKGRRSRVLVNLLEDFANSSAVARVQRDKILRALEIRGGRTHEQHLQIFLEHQEGEKLPVVVYADANPFRSTVPRIRFDDLERAEFSDALLSFLEWWCAQVRASLGVT